MGKNDLGKSVTKFCLAMEEHRRTEAGRVRTAKEFVTHFFPWDESKATDRLFCHLPNDVRGPIVSRWGIRGAKAALKDDDEKVKFVVHDAFAAGDLDDGAFEEGVAPETLVGWVPLSDWWTFWRNGKLTGVAIQKALATARELALIDERWFLDNLQGRGGRLKGTDVICDTLGKDQIVAWIRKVHENGDGSPKGLVGALGWETVLARTSQDALLFALDAFARKAGLVAPPATEAKSGGGSSSEGEVPTAQHEKVAEARPTMAVPDSDVPSDAVPSQPKPAVAEAAPAERDKRDSGLPVAIPDIPAIDGPPLDSDEIDDPPSMPSVEERSVWAEGGVEESPKLAQARAEMMKMLDPATGTPARGPEWDPSDSSEPPAHPSALEWPEPPMQNAAAASDPPISLDEADLRSERPNAGPNAAPPTPPRAR